MRFMIRGLFGLFLAALTVALILAAVTVITASLKKEPAGAGHGNGARERSFTVNVATVTPTKATPIIETFGEVISGRTLELRAASGGALVQMSENFREGGVVRKGDLLFQTDPATAYANAQLSQAALDEAKAEISEAEEAFGLAGDELKAAEHQYALRQQVLTRQTSLRERGVGTETALETAALAASAAQQASLVKRQALANAKARINRAKIALSRNRINDDEAARVLAQSSVIAKFDGVLSDVTGDLGALVNAGERLARLIDPNALEVSFRISNIEFNHLTQNDHAINQVKVFVRFDGIDTEINATIERVSAAVGEGQTGRELYASLDVAKIATVRPGDFVAVRLEEPALDNVVVLPATAVSATGEVLVLGQDDRLEVVSVSVLRKQGDQVIVAIGDLSGREVILERAPQLGEGIKVEPRRADGVLFPDKTTGN
ncbi:MAG: HlyD family efflux transporter periplasmic adaptor subunit [Amylibacter sp.]|nr:HlyD family efflux transporter periplasmic adaptor subunit [Amylibacter sp.]